MPKKKHLQNNGETNGDGNGEDVRAAVTLDGQRVDVIKRGGKLVANYQPLRWGGEVSVTDILPESESSEVQTGEAGKVISYWDVTTIRSSPGLLARLRRGDHLRESDAWDWRFEGPSDEITWIQLQWYQVIGRFRRKLPERKRERDRWIALHYIARTSQFCVRNARGDESEGRVPKSLINLSDERMAAVLSRDLKINDEPVTRKVIDDFQQFREGLSVFRGNLSRERLRKALGMESSPLPPPGPDLTRVEMNEKKDLEASYFKGALDPAGQKRLKSLLDQRTAYLRNKIAGKIKTPESAL